MGMEFSNEIDSLNIILYDINIHDYFLLFTYACIILEIYILIPNNEDRLKICQKHF